GELVELIGANLRLLATELEKLQAYAGDRAVTVEDVRLLTAQSREQSVFALVDAVVEGRAPLALRTMRMLLDDGSHAPPQLQAMIARQLRALVRATELLEHRAGQPEVAQATGLNGYPLTKLLSQARATTRPAVELALREVEATDHAVKTGR